MYNTLDNYYKIGPMALQQLTLKKEIMKHLIVLVAVFLSLKITARKPEMPSIIDLDAMTNPHVFSCDGYLKHDSDNGGFDVHYSACDVEYPKRLVQKKNGTFTVKRDGIYRLTFKAR